MDRRKVLQLLGVATATGAVLGTTVMNTVPAVAATSVQEDIDLFVKKAWKPNENGRGFYWITKMDGGIRVCVTLDRRNVQLLEVDGEIHANPVFSRWFPSEISQENIQTAKEELFTVMEKYWADPKASGFRITYDKHTKVAKYVGPKSSYNFPLPVWYKT